MQDGVITTDRCTRSRQKKDLSSFDYSSLKQFKNSSNITEWKNNSGVLIAVGRLENNIPTGYWKYFYDNGFIESEGLYKNGEFDGKWIKYLDPEGIVIRLRYDKKIPQDSTPDLQPLKNRVWEIQNYKEGLRDGEFVNYAYYSIDKPKSIIEECLFIEECIIDGDSFKFDLDSNGISILDAAYKAGADLPFACKGGVCCTCKARTITGEIRMDVNYALSPEELAQGYILTCQSHPISKNVVISFDD